MSHLKVGTPMLQSALQYHTLLTISSCFLRTFQVYSLNTLGNCDFTIFLWLPYISLVQLKGYLQDHSYREECQGFLGDISANIYIYIYIYIYIEPIIQGKQEPVETTTEITQRTVSPIQNGNSEQFHLQKCHERKEKKQPHMFNMPGRFKLKHDFFIQYFIP